MREALTGRGLKIHVSHACEVPPPYAHLPVLGLGGTNCVKLLVEYGTTCLKLLVEYGLSCFLRHYLSSTAN